MILGELIKWLKQQDPNKKVRFGFGRPHCYRGDYSCVAFEPVDNTTIGEMLKHAESALDKEFPARKGGLYKITRFSECYIAEPYSTVSDRIGPRLLKYWETD